jgi:hypothetical protein
MRHQPKAQLELFSLPVRTKVYKIMAGTINEIQIEVQVQGSRVVDMAIVPQDPNLGDDWLDRLDFELAGSREWDNVFP